MARMTKARGKKGIVLSSAKKLVEDFNDFYASTGDADDSGCRC